MTDLSDEQFFAALDRIGAGTGDPGEDRRGDRGDGGQLHPGDGANDITKVPLSRDEEIRLQRLEQVVEDGLDAFVAVGRALAAIRDGQLYRATHSTFAAYVKDRFELSPSYAYRKMGAAEVAAIVSPIGNIQNEAQARELVGLDKDRAVEVYQRAVAETAGRPTAAAIRTARNNASGSVNARMPRPDTTQRRAPLPDAFWDAMRDLRKRATTLANLTADDRWRSNVDTVRIRHRAELGRLIDELSKVYDALSGQPVQPELGGS